MKIEIGESLMLSWLRHVKNCQSVQLNWKPSTSTWKLHNQQEIETLMKVTGEYFKTEHNLDIFKQTKSYSQLLQQGEIDALGLKLEGPEVHEIYAIDVAFHEGGLNYGDKIKTVSGVIKKMLRTAMIMNGYFNIKEGMIIFASPKVNNAELSLLEPCVNDLNVFMQAQGFNYIFVLYVNDDFREEIFEPVLSLAASVADTSELFMRSIQLYNMFSDQAGSKTTKEKQRLEKRKTIPERIKATDESDEVKIGVLVRSSIRRLAAEGKISRDIAEKMTSYEYSKNIFNINYPLLNKIDPSQPLSGQKIVNGYPRYWSELVEIAGEKYLVCQEWFERDRNHFMRWLSSIDRN